MRQIVGRVAAHSVAALVDGKVDVIFLKIEVTEGLVRLRALGVVLDGSLQGSPSLVALSLQTEDVGELAERPVTVRLVREDLLQLDERRLQPALLHETIAEPQPGPRNQGIPRLVGCRCLAPRAAYSGL